MQDRNDIIWRKNNLQQLSFIGVVFVELQKEGGCRARHDFCACGGISC